MYGDGWAGTLDMVCMLNDKKYVIDFKTSKAFYPEHRYQVAAYRWAVDEIEIPKPGANATQGSGILRLDKESGLPSWHDCSKTFEQDLEVFQAMVDLYFKRHKIIAKKVFG